MSCLCRMITCLDVYYEDDSARAAGVLVREWTDAVPVEERVVAVAPVAAYQPGEFFRRELPCLLAILKALPPVDVIVVDGYVWLDALGKPGLGAYLYRALNEQAAVVGVAKTKFHSAEGAHEVLRGESARPLYVTAAGFDAAAAARQVVSMAGQFRIPALLQRVDWLCRHGSAA